MNTADSAEPAELMVQQAFAEPEGQMEQQASAALADKVFADMAADTAFADTESADMIADTASERQELASENTGSLADAVGFALFQARQ